MENSPRTYIPLRKEDCTRGPMTRVDSDDVSGCEGEMMGGAMGSGGCFSRQGSQGG